MRALAAALLGLTLATPAAAQPTPQPQTPNLQQRGQQLLQGLTGNQNQNPQQAAPGTYDRDRSDRYGDTQRSYRDQRQPDQGARGRDDGYGNAQRPYQDQRQLNQNYRGPAYDPGAGSPRYPSPPGYQGPPPGYSPSR